MLKSSEAIFAVVDVVATIRFYREVLGFEGEWLWGDPPTFGAVRWGKVQIMFCQQHDLAKKVEGHQHFLFCEDIDALHERHRAAGASIIDEIENKPWGTREYVIRDVNGYYLRFAGSAAFQRSPSGTESMPATVRIVERLPSVFEYARLALSVGWNTTTDDTIALEKSLYGLVAVDRSHASEPLVVGTLRVVGDGVKFFYIQDVMVQKEYQNQRIGSAMMESVLSWLKASASKGAFVGLFTGKPSFYERFGFQGTSGGMSLWL